MVLFASSDSLNSKFLSVLFMWSIIVFPSVLFWSNVIKMSSTYLL